MAIVGTAYVRIKALAGDMARDIENSLKPMQANMQKMGQEAGQNFSNSFADGVGSGGGKDINPAEGAASNTQREMNQAKNNMAKAHRDMQKQSKNSLDQLAQNFKNTGKKASNNFVQNFGMGIWFRLIHRLYDLFLFITPAIGAVAGGLGQLVGGLYAMASTLGSALNTVAIAPGLFYAMGASIIALNVGLKDSLSASAQGFKAMKALATGAADADKEMQKYQESLKGLGPEARKFTETLVGMSGTFMDISSNIQSALLPNLTKALEKLRDNNVIDAFGRSFTEVAGELGKVGLKLASLTDSPIFRGRLETIFGSTNKVVASLGQAFVNVIEALTNVAAAAAPVTEEFAEWIELVTGNWASKSSSNFEGLQDSIAKSSDAMKLVGDVIGNLWGTLKGLGKAGSDAGNSLWSSFNKVAKRWNEFVNSVEGQKVIGEWFDIAAEGTKHLGDAFRELGKIFSEAAKSDVTMGFMENLGPVIAQLGDMILRMTEEAGPALGRMVLAVLDLLDALTEGQGVSAFADTITGFAKILTGMLSGPVGHGLLFFIATFVGIFKASSIIAQVIGFRNAITGMVRAASNISKAGGVANWFRGYTRSTDAATKGTKVFQSGFFGGLARIRDGLRTLVSSSVTGFKTFGSNIGRFAGVARTGAINAAKGLASGASAFASGARNMVLGGVSGVRAGMSNLSGAVRTGAVNAAGGMRNAMSAAATGTVSVFNKAGNGIKKGFGGALSFIGRINPFGILLTALELLLPIFVTLYASSEKFRDSVNGFFGSIKDAVAPLFPIFKDIGTAFAESFGAMFDSGSGDGGGASSFVADTIGKLQEILPALEPIASAVGGFLGNVFSNVGPVLSEVGKVIGDIFSAIGPSISDMSSSVGPALSGLGSSLSGVFSAVGPVIADLAAKLGPIVVELAPELAAAFGRLYDAVGELLPVLGDLVGDVISELGPVIADILPVLGELVSSLITLGGDAVSTLAPVISDLVSSLLPVLADMFKSLVPVIMELVSGVLPLLVNLIGIVLPAAFALILPIVKAVFSALIPIITAVVDVLTGVVTFLTGVFTGDWSKAWDGIKQIFVGLWDLIVGAVSGALNIIWALLSSWYSGIFNVVSVGMQALWGVITTVWNNIVSFFASIFSSIVAANVLAWNTFKNGITTVFNYVRGFISNVINAVRNTILSIVAAIVTNAMGAWNRFRAGTQAAFNAVRTLVTNVINGVRNTVANVVGRIVSAVTGAWGKVRSSTQTTWNTFKSLVTNGVNNAISVVKGLPGKVTSALSGLANKMKTIAGQMITGFVNGIKNGASRVFNAAKDMANKAMSAAKKALGIASPSKQFRAIGKFVGQGFVKGLKGSESQVQKASQDLANKVQASFKAGDMSKKTYNRTIDIIRKGNIRMLGLARTRAQIADQMKKAQEQLNDAVKTRNDASSQIRESMIDTFNFDSIKKNMSVDDIVKQMKDSTKMVKDFQNQLKNLKKLGVSNEVYEQIVSAGAVRGTELAKAISQNGRAGVQQISQEYKNLYSASAGVGKDASNTLYQSGVDIANGLIKGLRSQEKAVAKEADKMAKNISKAVKKALKIKSPSRVLAELGQMTAQGLVKGLNDMGSQVSKAAATLGNRVADGASSTLGAKANISASSVASSLSVPAPSPISAVLKSDTMDSKGWDNSTVLSPQNRAIVTELSKFVGTTQNNTFNIQKDRPIAQLAQEITRELERTK